MPASSTAVILLVTQVVLDLLPLLAPVALFRVGPWPGVTVLTSAALPAILAGLIVSGPLVAGSVTALAQVLVGLVYAWRGLRDRARLVLTPLVMFGAVQLAGLGYHAVAGVAPTSLASTRVLAAAVLAGFVLITVKVGFVGCWSAVILHRPLGRTIHDYLRSATPKLEALMVLLGPVLAVMYQLQPVAGLLGLVPLFGLYYLSSIEQRLERQTWELQRTASDLHAAVGRREQVEQTLAQITAAQEEERR
ncbi:MAG: hypothetical protein HY335_00715, partial [Deinococcus sp.]|nr:hypothetical protein [Deinococcus sp.]